MIIKNSLLCAASTLLVFMCQINSSTFAATLDTPTSNSQLPTLRTPKWTALAEFQFQTLGAHGSSWLGASLFRTVNADWLVGIRPLSSISDPAQFSIGAVIRKNLETTGWFMDNTLTRHFDRGRNDPDWLLSCTFGREYKQDNLRIATSFGFDGWDALISRQLISKWFSPRLGLTTGWTF